jgi:hypothetical protein
MTGLMGVTMLFLATAAVRAEPAPADLGGCLALNEEGDIRACADKYIARACQPTVGAHEPLTCTNAVRARVAARVNADRSCMKSGEVSICAMLPDEKVAKACSSRCIKARETGMHATAEREQDACEASYIEAGGRGKFSCILPGAIPGIDLDSAKFEARMKAATQARDLAEIDELAKESDGQFLWNLQTDCTKACNERAPKLLAAQKQGSALVTAYKRCMMAADSTLETLKLAVYETGLYCDNLQKADARCRAASKCEWIERFSDIRCTYASPGVDRCQ